MTTNEAVRIVAEYDGWLIVPEGTYTRCHSQTTWYGHGGKFDCYHDVTAESDMPYLTNLNELHRVALGVMDLLKQSKTAHWQFNNSLIIEGLCSKPINNQYIDLLFAVARGVEFINDNKNKAK